MEQMIPISEEQALHLFLEGLRLIKESGMFAECGAYAPGGWGSDDSPVVAIYLSSDPDFLEYVRAYRGGADGE